MKFDILAVPTSLGTLGKYKDVENGPNIVLENIKHEEILPEENQEELLNKIYNWAKEKSNFIAVGGDHSISFPLIKSFLEKNKNGIVVLFDAHADAEVATNIATHEDWVRMLIDKRILKPENLVVVGVRKITSREQEFFDKNEIELLDEIPELPKNAPVYLSIDIDVLDPEECNDFYFKENGGISVNKLFSEIERIRPQIVSADIVELCPNLGSGKGIKIAKKILETIAPVV